MDTLLAAGFLIFHVAEKTRLLQHAHEIVDSSRTHPHVGVLSALAHSEHSFLDGVGIGPGFQVSPAVGIVVAIAVVAHDVRDGLNTVTLMLVHRNSQRRAFGMLFVDAAAPVLGAASTLLFPDAGTGAAVVPRLLRQLPALHRRQRHPAAGPSRRQ